MFNTTDDPIAAIANDKADAVNSGIGSIAYVLSAEQEKKRINRISQRRALGSGTNTNYRS